MWGDNLRLWFELFAGMAVHHGGSALSDGWLSFNDIEGRFRRENITFNGSKYDPSDPAQQNALLEAFIRNAGALCFVRLLERRRKIVPPSLDYRVTTFGRVVNRWGYGTRPGFRKRLVFFVIEVFFRLLKFKKLVALGAAGWVMLNAVKFYGVAWDWLSQDVFATVSAVIVGLVIWLTAVFLGHPNKD